MTVNWSPWKKTINEGCKVFKPRRIENFSLKQALRKQDLISVCDTLQTKHVFNICRKVCFSTASIASPFRSHDRKLSKTRFTKVLPKQPIGNSCREHELSVKKVYFVTKCVGLWWIWEVIWRSTRRQIIYLSYVRSDPERLTWPEESHVLPQVLFANWRDGFQQCNGSHHTRTPINK